MFDRHKVSAYMESFSFIDNIFLLKERYLMVAWHHATPDPSTLDVYRLTDKKRVVFDLKIIGRVIGTDDSTVFTLEDRADGSQVINLFEWTE